jgi:ketosteroid isomerase-like protein
VIGATIVPMQETASEAITKLIYTYAERIDAGDFAGVAEVFAHATLTFEGFGDAVSGVRQFRPSTRRTTRRYEDGTPRTKHVMTNVMVDVADEMGRPRRAAPTSPCCRPCRANWHCSR